MSVAIKPANRVIDFTLRLLRLGKCEPRRVGPGRLTLPSRAGVAGISWIVSAAGRLRRHASDEIATLVLAWRRAGWRRACDCWRLDHQPFVLRSRKGALDEIV